MKPKNEQLAKTKEEIRLMKANIRALKKAKKNCTCDGKELHYHVLLSHDSESGDEYFATSDAKHRKFIDKLNGTVVRLEGQLDKLKGNK